MKTQPVPAAHESTVQFELSAQCKHHKGFARRSPLHIKKPVPRQKPPVQRSPVVHRSLSEHWQARRLELRSAQIVRPEECCWRPCRLHPRRNRWCTHCRRHKSLADPRTVLVCTGRWSCMDQWECTAHYCRRNSKSSRHKPTAQSLQAVIKRAAYIIRAVVGIVTAKWTTRTCIRRQATDGRPSVRRVADMEKRASRDDFSSGEARSLPIHSGLSEVAKLAVPVVKLRTGSQQAKRAIACLMQLASRHVPCRVLNAITTECFDLCGGRVIRRPLLH